MNTTNNLERLIQMAAVEQMYSMMQKLKENNECVMLPEKHKEKERLEEIQEIQEMQRQLIKLFQQIQEVQRQQINNILESVSVLNIEIKQLNCLLKKEKETDDKPEPLSPIVGQTLITDYPIFIKREKEHIKLKIEEIDNKEKEETDDDFNPVLITCSNITLNNDETKEIIVVDDDEVDEVDEDNEEDDEDEVVDDEVVDDELSVGEELGEHETEEMKPETEEIKPETEENLSSEEEVCTDEDDDTNGKELVEEIKEDDKDVEDEEEEKEDDEEEKEDEEEDEEVFEIEIDDVTYFATGEENGVLYEMTKDGEVGKKVGIIKDGDVIFS
jgi:hypothetical protein